MESCLVCVGNSQNCTGPRDSNFFERSWAWHESHALVQIGGPICGKKNFRAEHSHDIWRLEAAHEILELRLGTEELKLVLILARASI